MHLVVTGGAGFLGQQCIARLLQMDALRLEPAPARRIIAITAFDVVPGDLEDPRLRYCCGDIADPYQVSALLREDTAAVIHLAAVVSGTAEADFDLGLRVNLDGTRNLLQACRARLAMHPDPVEQETSAAAREGVATRDDRSRPGPVRLLFSSSIAVFGGRLPEVVTDDTMPTPQGSYDIQKYMGEQLVQDYTRKGFVDGRSVRIPTVVVRPGKPNGAASGFASSIIREPLAGRPAVLPVDPETAMWVASPRAVVRMLLRALELAPERWGWHRAINLPGLTVTMREEMAALRAAAGEGPLGRIETRVDPAVVRLVQTWAARFDTARASAMGLEADRDFAAILSAYMEDHPEALHREPRTAAP